MLQNAYYDGNLYLGYNSADSGTYNFSAGNLTVANRIYVGYSGTGSSRSRAEPVPRAGS